VCSSDLQTPAVRERMVSGLLNVAPELASAVASGLGIRDLPAPMPKALQREIRPEVSESPALSLMARPGDGSVAGRRVALLAADGVESGALRALADHLTGLGAVPRYVAPMLGPIQPADGDAIEADTSVEATPSVLFDAVVVPDGRDGVGRLIGDGRTLEFVKDQYRHCKPMLVFGAGVDLLARAGIPNTLPSGNPDPGLIVPAAGDAAAIAQAFVAALQKHRHYERETDPPLV